VSPAAGPEGASPLGPAACPLRFRFGARCGPRLKSRRNIPIRLGSRPSAGPGRVDPSGVPLRRWAGWRRTGSFGHAGPRPALG
jgi:hypothetical protein